jgi:hypothetical protein
MPSPGAQETQRIYPYTLGAGAEVNQNTRESTALGYGVALDRTLGSERFLAGLRGFMDNDYSGISAVEGEFYLRLNLIKLGPGWAFSQLGWGFVSFREEENQVQNMLLDFTMGYRLFFLGGFYVEPYIRTGFPVRLGAGIMAGHWFDF